MAASSIKVIGSVTSYAINDLNGITQQIPVPTTTTGNTLVVCVAVTQFYFTPSHITSVTDSASNTWTQRGTTQTSGNGAGHVQTQIFTADNATSATWIKVTSGAQGSMVNVHFLELTGCTTSATDTSNGGTATSATTITASNTPSVAGDIVLFFAATGGQSLAHSTDGTQNIDRLAVPYPSGTAGAGCVSSLQSFTGASTVAMSTTWTGASGNFAWSTVSLKASTPGTGGLYQVFSGNGVSAQDINQLINLLNGTTTSIPVLVSNRIQAALSGATALSGYVGGTTSGAPVSGTFQIGDFITDQQGLIWVCTASGSPGTWTRVGTGGYLGRAHQTATQGYTGSASLVPVTMAASPDFDPRSMWQSGSSAFKIPFSGARWRIIAGQHVSTGANSGRFYVSITINGTEVSRGYDGPTVSGNAGGIVSDIQPCNANDLVRAAFVCTATGNTVGTSAANFLTVCLADA